MTDTTSLLSTGASSARVDIAFVAEGYTAAERAQFLQDANGLLTYMTGLASRSLNDPFYSYSSMFNASATFVASQQAGYDINGTLVNTAFDAAAYGFDNRLVYGNPNKVFSAVAHLTAAQAADMVIVLINSSNYGGAGGPVAWTTARNSNSYEIALHEIGHSFADLHDEYVDASIANSYPLSLISDSVHVSTQSNPSLVNWSEWVGYTDSLGTVGAYEGGYYRSTGVWRATPNSKMLFLGSPFSAPQKEAFIDRFYDLVGDFLAVTSADWMDYAGATIDNSLFRFSWSVNGQAIQSGASALFNLEAHLRTQADGDRNYTVSATASDSTGNIREAAVAANATETENRLVNVIKASLGDGANNQSYSGNRNFFILAEGGADSISFASNGSFGSFADGGDGADSLAGSTGADTLLGGDANDTLNGGAGADDLRGGSGIDTATYAGAAALRASLANTAVNTGDAAGDTYHAIEGLTGGAGNDTLEGDGLANTLNGGGGADSMTGGLGGDTYVVDSTGDITLEAAGEGTDTVASSISHTLQANVENLTLTGTGTTTGIGNTLANLLIGNTGNNILDGGTGGDAMRGGAGNDRYTFDNAGDTASELAGEGLDTVIASVAHTLRPDFENLTIIGAATNAFGSSVANILTGNGLNNILNGKEANDIMTGGAGIDTFMFDTALGPTNVDRITDFVAVDDVFRLGATIFTGIGTGTLSAAAFRAGTSAGDASDRIIYNQATGRVFYDADGLGGTAQVLFAVLDTKPANVTSADFVVI